MKKENYEIYRKAYKEFWEISKCFSREDYAKIPEDFIKFIEENMDKEYTFVVEHVDDFQNQKMLKETRAILAVVYRDYLASREEKQEILKKEEQEKQKNNKPFDVEEILGKINEQKQYTPNEIIETPAIVQKEKWYERIVNKIKKIFKR